MSRKAIRPANGVTRSLQLLTVTLANIQKITYGRCELMKAYALIAFDVPDNKARDFSKGLNLALENFENYDVLKIIPKEEITLESCRFPHKLINLLNISGINSIADLEQYTFQRLVRLFIRNGIEGRQRTVYLEYIIKTLKSLGLSLSQSEENNLIELNDCGLSQQMLKRLNKAGYYYIQDIADSTQFIVSQIKGIRSRSQQILEDKMKENGVWYVG